LEKFQNTRLSLRFTAGQLQPGMGKARNGAVENQKIAKIGVEVVKKIPPEI